MAELQLAVIDVQPGASLESQSGLQMLRPRIYGAWRAPAGPKKVAAIVMHPTSNFMGHYLIGPLADRGIACMGLNSRYMGNDTLLLMERAIQDLGAGVQFLRAAGYERVLLIGNSGGAALASFYQAQAEKLTAHRFPDGDETHLHPHDLPPVDGIALCAAHPGRSKLLRDWIDPSVTDEHDPLSVDPALDMYDARHALPYAAGFLARFSAAQAARLERIERWVIERLRLLRSTPGAPRDQAFIVYRTHADPRCVDLSIDSNDRLPGSVWGDARQVNYSANAMGRTTSLTAFLSQWSSRSQADGPSNLARTRVPLLLLTYTGDASTFPSTRDAWMAAGGARIRNVDIVGGNHYLAGQPQLVQFAANAIAGWAEAL
ncbi:Alpha/beta hydrolase family protein (plasmid) [Variovorax sp. SRS16]|uniref:alpha/beta hydrolase family protein n=1 Tax=Variovorax sp. SRS16 TaxID=282217 RepID=UPI001317583F|nr:alpha/beta fold hydrolase [Variovorax sp. SRS16]VTU46745.1 Alpha/beta hydrolase family protein [Variovorax sp. SRS16]